MNFPYSKVVYRQHALQRMFSRKVTEEEIFETLENGTIIDHYPDDKPYSSYLLLGWPNKRPLHVVAADNTEDKETIIVTAYEPAPSLWNKNFDKRV